MPVKLGSKLPPESAEARIEIVPLIDIMFFLLAAFMLVSLSMVNLKSVRVNLPTAATATPDTKKDIIDISVNKAGLVFVDKKPVDDHELVSALSASQRANPQMRVFISGDRDARHGDIIHVLDLVRSAGIDRIAFEIREQTKAVTPMNHFLQGFNLIGILALAVLCAAQWQTNSRLIASIHRLEAIRDDQAAKIDDQAKKIQAEDKTIQQDAEDLADIQKRLAISESALTDTRLKLAATVAERDRIAVERDQLKANLPQWIAAVAARDEALKKADDAIQKIAAERNDIIVKFNDVVGKYNELVTKISKDNAK